MFFTVLEAPAGRFGKMGEKLKKKGEIKKTSLVIVIMSFCHSQIKKSKQAIHASVRILSVTY